MWLTTNLDLRGTFVNHLVEYNADPLVTRLVDPSPSATHREHRSSQGNPTDRLAWWTTVQYGLLSRVHARGDRIPPSRPVHCLNEDDDVGKDSHELPEAAAIPGQTRAQRR
ncbi:hypothetical protein KACC15558_19320 [Brevibacterium ammoniilyticum]|uniref:Uncharacterized protein n=1 Tax=Brevibacterium ammoniilyticum TaxID=1046555 RepID=A0ABP9TZU9_9MICO